MSQQINGVMIARYCTKFRLLTRKTAALFYSTTHRFYSGSMDDKFLEYWQETTSKLPDNLTLKWGELIVTKYGESQRYYHRLKHVIEMKTHRDHFQHKLHEPKLVDYAIIFHE